MTSFNFFLTFGTIVETMPIIPFFFAMKNWHKLSVGAKYISFFFISDFALNLVQDYYYLQHTYNLFTYYFYSITQAIFIFLGLYHFFNKESKLRYITIFLLVISVFILYIDFIFISKIGLNYISGLTVDLLIFCLSCYCLSSNLKPKIKNFEEVKVLESSIILILTLQFFIKFIDLFLGKYLLENQANGYLWIQERNIYNYFMFFCFGFYIVIFRFTLNKNEV